MIWLKIHKGEVHHRIQKVYGITILDFAFWWTKKISEKWEEK